MTPPASSPATPRPVSAPDAIVYGWRRLMAGPGPWVGFMVLASLASVVVSGIGLRVVSADGASVVEALGIAGPASAQRLLGVFLVAFGQTMALGTLCSAALRLTSRARLRLVQFFEGVPWGPVAGIALVTALVHAVLALVPVLGAALAALLWLPVTLLLLLAVDDALASWRTPAAALAVVRAQPAPTIVLWLLVLVVNAVGAFLCGLGLLVTIPLTVIAQASALRVARGRPVR